MLNVEKQILLPLIIYTAGIACNNSSAYGPGNDRKKVEFNKYKSIIENKIVIRLIF